MNETVSNIVFWCIGVPVSAFVTYKLCQCWNQICDNWINKKMMLKTQDEALREREKDFRQHCASENFQIENKMTGAILKYKEALEAIKVAESIREGNQKEMDKLRNQIKELEKQLHHARQRGVRLSERVQKTTME